MLDLILCSWDHASEKVSEFFSSVGLCLGYGLAWYKVLHVSYDLPHLRTNSLIGSFIHCQSSLVDHLVVDLVLLGCQSQSLFLKVGSQIEL